MANFFILAFILYRFLFKPLQKVLKKREADTNRALDEAKEAQKDAEEIHRQYEEKNNNIDAEIAARKNEARMVIERTRQQMLNEVQTEINDLKSQTEETLTHLRIEALQKHKEKVGNLASEFAKGILTDLMSPDLQKSYQEAFLGQLNEMDLSQYVEEPVPGKTSFVRIISAKPPDETFQKNISAIIHEKLPQEVTLSFEVEPKLIAGGILRFENELIDGSMQGQVDQFQKQYQEIA
jgi:F-type H+-transporting ATPase subunit b